LSTRCHPLGEPVYYGDVSRPELLHRVHASAASAIVLTMDHAEAAVHAASAIRREFGAVPLFARARDEYHARALKEAGANLVAPEVLETGLQLASFVFHSLGVDVAEIEAITGQEREARIAAIMHKE
jgi:CPA2 family monovalent cation:H+ antiporter-2